MEESPLPAPARSLSRLLIVADGPQTLEQALDDALPRACARALVTVAIIVPGPSRFAALAPMDTATLEHDSEAWAAQVARDGAERCPPTMGVRHLVLPDGDCARIVALAESVQAEAVVLRVTNRRVRRRWARHPSAMPIGEPPVPPTALPV